MKHETHSPEETKKIGADLAATLKGGEVIELHGDLGSGKTTFVQGLAAALGYDGPVRSPTFTIMNIYPAEHKTIKEIVHIDLYRFEEEPELRALGLEEWLQRDDVVILIEWPGVAESSLGSDRIRVNMKFVNENQRNIDINRV